MAQYSNSSKEKLRTCHPLLQQLFNTVVLNYDCTIIAGRREKAKQDQYFADGKSKLQWPNSKHNATPPELSMAVDAAPFENTAIDWSRDQCLHFGGFVLGVATVMGINVRWGGDWDRDNDVQDQSFNDLVHFELTDI